MSSLNFSPPQLFRRMSQSLAPEEAARFRRLPFYLEHKLLLQKFDGESEWEFEVTDPTWQAICWYYCFALRLALAGKTEPALDVVLKALESGTALNHFEAYPHDWDPDGILNLRDPADVAMDLMGHAYELSHLDIKLSNRFGWIRSPHEAKQTRRFSAFFQGNTMRCL